MENGNVYLSRILLGHVKLSDKIDGGSIWPRLRHSLSSSRELQRPLLTRPWQWWPLAREACWQRLFEASSTTWFRSRIHFLSCCWLKKVKVRQDWTLDNSSDAFWQILRWAWKMFPRGNKINVETYFSSWRRASLSDLLEAVAFLDRVLHDRAVEADEWRLVELALKAFRFRVPLPPSPPATSPDDWTGLLGGRGGGGASAAAVTGFTTFLGEINLQILFRLEWSRLVRSASCAKKKHLHKSQFVNMQSMQLLLWNLPCS